MGATNAGYANTVNTLLAVARLNQVADENVSRQELRRGALLKKQEETQAIETANREKAFQTQAEGTLGDKLTPESSSYVNDIRPLFARNASVTGELPRDNTKVGGFQLPGELVNRSPQPSDVADAFRKADVTARGETNLRLRSLGINEDNPVAQSLMTQKQTPFPSQVAARLQEAEAVKQGSINTQSQGVKLRSDTVKAVKDEALQESDIEKGKAESRTAQANAIEADAKAIYADHNALNDARVKAADAGLKEADLAADPVKREQARLNVTKTRLDIAKGNEELRNTIEIRTLANRVNSMADGPEKDKAVRDLAVKQGHAVEALITAPLAIKKAYGEAVEQQTKLELEARKLAILGDDASVQASVATMANANKMSINAAEISGSPTVKLTSVVPGGKGLFGGSGAQVGQANVNTEVAKLYSLGYLEKAANLQMALPGWRPEQALAEKIRIEHAYAGADSTVYAAAISRSAAPTPVKEAALELLNKRSSNVEPVTRGETSSSRESGASLPLSQENMPTEASKIEQRDIQESDKLYKLQSAAANENKGFLQWLAPRISPKTPGQLSNEELKQWKSRYSEATNGPGL